MFYFIIIFTILYIGLAWKRLDLGVSLLIMALPLYQIRFSILSYPSTLLEVMIFILFLVWFVKSWRNKELPLLNPPSLKLWWTSKKLKNVKNYPFYIEIIAVLIIAFISTLVAGANSVSLGILKAYFIEPIMFFIVFINIFSAQGGSATGWKVTKNQKYIFWALSLSALIVSVVAIYQRITGNLIPADWTGTGRVTGVFTYPNAVGLYLGPIILILLGWLIYLAKNFQFSIFNPSTLLGTGFQTIFNAKIFNIMFVSATVVLSVLAVYFAKSEGALIGIMAALFIFGLLYNKKSRITVITTVIIGIAVLGVNSELRHDVTSKVMLRDLDGQIRRQIWAETWEMLQGGRIITGAGLANYQNIIKPYHQEGIFVRDYNDPDFQRKVVFNEEYKKNAWQPTEIYLYPHNILLNFWSELGLVGMLLFGWIIIKFFIIGIRSSYTKASEDKNYELGMMQREIVMGLMGAMIVVVVHGLVDVPYFKNDLSILFWVLIGILGVLNIETKNARIDADNSADLRG